jgi:uncharacterized protein (TIGR02145 family)
MKILVKRTLAFTWCCVMFLCGLTSEAQTLKDISGNEYKIVKHGLQEWSASNLNVSRFRNGDIIPEAKTDEEWKNAGIKGKPVWCYFNNDPENAKLYGKLYNWYAINDPRGIAPLGWHVPGNRDWSTLVKNLIGVDIAGERLKSKTVWKSKPGVDYFGFAALPGGFRDGDGKFQGFGVKCQIWSNSEPVEVVKSNLIYSVVLNDNTVELSFIKMKKESGLSLRIEKD